MLIYAKSNEYQILKVWYHPSLRVTFALPDLFVWFSIRFFFYCDKNVIVTWLWACCGTHVPLIIIIIIGNILVFKQISPKLQETPMNQIISKEIKFNFNCFICDLI